MDRYEFNAPRFVDFTVTEEDDREDDYFGTIQNGVTATKTEADNCNSVRATDDLAMECKTSSPPLQVAIDVEDDLARTMEVLHVSEQTPSAKRFSSKKGMPSSSDRKSHAMITRLNATTGRFLEVSQALDFTQEPETAPTYKFTAQPVPKNLLSPRPSICNVRPAVHVRRRLEHHKVFASALQENNSEDVLVQKEVFNFGVPLEIRKNTPLKRSTEVKPFSFEDRNKEVARRKEEKIKMFLEEEKQAHIFHAQPLPGVYRRRMGSNPDVSIMSTASMVETGSDENKNPAVFKAHPAIVLKKEPFVPSKIDRSPLKPRNHMLKTEVRAKERKEFEEKVRAEMEELEKLRKEYEEQKHLEEEAKASAQRRLAESFRAQPVPKFKTPKKPLPRN